MRRAECARRVLSAKLASMARPEVNGEPESERPTLARRLAPPLSRGFCWRCAIARSEVALGVLAARQPPSSGAESRPVHVDQRAEPVTPPSTEGLLASGDSGGATPLSSPGHGTSFRDL